VAEAVAKTGNGRTGEVRVEHKLMTAPSSTQNPSAKCDSRVRAQRRSVASGPGPRAPTYGPFHTVIAALASAPWPGGPVNVILVLSAQS